MIGARDDPPAPLPHETAPTPRVSRLRKLALALRDIFNPSSPPRRILRYDDPRRIDSDMQLSKLAGWPVVILEYLENGTLGRLIDRMIFYNAYLPNRLLFSIFLCCK